MVLHKILLNSKRICSGQWSGELEKNVSNSGQTAVGENAGNLLWNFSFAAGMIHKYTTISWKALGPVLFLQLFL